ncbi:MAG TPA: methyl-accepting chemotaxis protein [Steroidobacteraceae bacterium]|jgi:methyl-accepting chemotaxis protein
MRWNIRSRLICLVALLLALMVLVGINAQHGMGRASKGLHSVLTTSHGLRNHIESDMMHDALRADVLAALLAANDAEAAQVSDDLKEHARTFRDLIAANNALALNPEARKALTDVGPSLDRYIAGAEAIVAAARTNKQQANQMLPDFLRLFRDLEGRLADVSDRIQSSATDAEQDAEHAISEAEMLDTAAMLLAAIVAIVFATLIVRSILAGVARLTQAITPLADGKLGREIVVDSDDEFGRLLLAMRAMDGKLTNIVGNVRVTASSLRSAAGEISGSNDDLSQRTQEQAAALEETASSMEEMSTTVRQNAQNAQAAQQLAVGARQQADQGGQVVQRAIDAMGAINDSSRRIADIIGTIDEIAFQTNLLALNAAVEAARAGEQGRGFAVVASEVRNLAQRSATAAKEIKNLIGDSVEKVKAGTALVDESGRTITGIMESIRKVTNIVGEIAVASGEQATGVDQVNRAVTQIDHVTQQNAALVEQCAAASKLMASQTEQLLTQIDFFEIHGQRSQATRGEQHHVGSPRSATAEVIEYRRAG